MIKINGETYKIRRKLKFEFDGIWNQHNKNWSVPEKFADAAQKLADKNTKKIERQKAIAEQNEKEAKEGYVYVYEVKDELILMGKRDQRNRKPLFKSKTKEEAEAKIESFVSQDTECKSYKLIKRDYSDTMEYLYIEYAVRSKDIEFTKSTPHFFVINLDPVDVEKVEKEEREQIGAKAKAGRNLAKSFGGKALAGTMKQKEWGETIRAEKLSQLKNDDDARILCTESNAKFFIENREKLASELLKIIKNII